MEMTKRLEPDLTRGISLLPSFPIVLVTVGRNIMTAGAFHFFSFDPPAVMVGIMPDKHTYRLLDETGAFGINVPRTDQIDVGRQNIQVRRVG